MLTRYDQSVFSLCQYQTRERPSLPSSSVYVTCYPTCSWLTHWTPETPTRCRRRHWAYPYRCHPGRPRRLTRQRRSGAPAYMLPRCRFVDTAERARISLSLLNSGMTCAQTPAMARRTTGNGVCKTPNRPLNAEKPVSKRHRKVRRTLRRVSRCPARQAASLRAHRVIEGSWRRRKGILLGDGSE